MLDSDGFLDGLASHLGTGIAVGQGALVDATFAATTGCGLTEGPINYVHRVEGGSSKSSGEKGEEFHDLPRALEFVRVYQSVKQSVEEFGTENASCLPIVQGLRTTSTR